MNVEVTVQHDEYRPLGRALNAASFAAMAVGVNVGRLDRDAIVAKARRRTGLTDLGGRQVIDGLEVLLHSARKALLTPLGRVVFEETGVAAVANHLRLVQWKKEATRLPEVSRPIFVLGFPRTGTTLLQNLLQLEHGRRALQFWELMTPLHPGTDAERRRTAALSIRAALLVAPEMQAVHEIHPDSFEECWPLFYNSCSGLSIDLQTGMREYGDFLLHHHDMGFAYDNYKSYLQALLQQRPAEQLVLKCPEHLWFVDELLDTFPDACIVWTHRDPVDSIASYCSLISLQRRTLYGRIDREKLGRDITERFLQGVERAMTARDRRRAHHQFLDIDFLTLVKDPHAQVRRIAEHFDLPYGNHMDRAITHWLGTEREDSRGSHKYRADRYGLDIAEIRRRYARYVDAFDITLRKAA